MSFSTLVLALVLAMVTITICAVATILIVVYGARRSNRITPRTTTTAPTAWLASPSAPGRMHRRLRASVRAARRLASRPGADATLVRQVDELERQGVALDDQLTVAATGRGSERRERLARIDARIGELERICQRLTLAAAPLEPSAGPIPEPSGLARLAEELDAQEAARREVEQVERHGPTGT